MGMLRLMGYGAYVLGGLALIMATEHVMMIAAAISLVATGTLFLAADQVIVILGQIRDRLPKPATPEETSAPAFSGAPRSAEEIAADLHKLRAAKP